MEDNRVQSALQAKMVETMQRDAMDEDDLLQGKFAVQRDVEDEDELLQRKICGPTANEEPDRDSGSCNQGMESSFGTDFSSIRVHPDSSKAPEVGALAYTQGTDIHFAPGQFKPETSAGQQLLGHELTHVIQQAEDVCSLLRGRWNGR